MSRRRSGARRPVPVSVLATLLVSPLVAAWPSVAWSGAWARDAGEAYVKASVASLVAREMYDASGNVRPLLDPETYDSPRYSEIGATLYGEYGLFKALTLVGSLPLKDAQQEAEGRAGAGGIYGDTFGFGDCHLGARVPLRRRAWAAALEPDLKIPLYGKPEPGTSDPALGTGFVDLGAALYVGVSLPDVHGYAQGSAGYRIRGGRTSEETYWDLEVGFQLARPLQARFRYDGVNSHQAESASAASPGTVALAPSVGEQDYHRVAPTLALGLGGNNELSVTWRKVVGGRSTIRSSEWEIGFSFLGSVVPVPEP